MARINPPRGKHAEEDSGETGEPRRTGDARVALERGTRACVTYLRPSCKCEIELGSFFGGLDLGELGRFVFDEYGDFICDWDLGLMRFKGGTGNSRWCVTVVKTVGRQC